MRYMKYTFYNYFCDSLFMMTEYNKEKECGTKKNEWKESRKKGKQRGQMLMSMEWNGMGWLFIITH